MQRARTSQRRVQDSPPSAPPLLPLLPLLPLRKEPADVDATSSNLVQLDVALRTTVDDSDGGLVCGLTLVASLVREEANHARPEVERTGWGGDDVVTPDHRLTAAVCGLADDAEAAEEGAVDLAQRGD